MMRYGFTPMQINEMPWRDVLLFMQSIPAIHANEELYKWSQMNG